MKNIKKKIKSILPDKVLYFYSILQKVPKYVNALKHNKNIKYPNMKFYDDVTTVDFIVNEHKSLARFGDSEFFWMKGESFDSYQNYSEDLSNDLIKAFKSTNEKILIGIPYGVVNSKKCNLNAKLHWEIIKADSFERILEFVDLNKTYCNASISRPYIDYSDYQFSTDNFNNLKRIWDNRDIVFVEGEKSKLGMGNDLFSNAKSIKRIICPATNSYEKKELIKNSILKNVSKETMILASLGPTASILAVEMTELGYQFVDIGQVDVEYMWYLKHSVLRDEIPGKYVNESGSKVCSNIYDNDERYLNSIIDRIV